MTKELRFAVARELRAAGTDKAPRIEGYACTWRTRTNIGQFYEVIDPKPFSSLNTDDVVCLVNHNDDQILGRAGRNLELTQDDIGLKFSCAIADTTVARDTYSNLKAGILSECSFAFTVNPNGETWTQLPDGSSLRTLKNLRLWDVSVVTSPAYPGTSAGARNIVAPDIEARMASIVAQSGLEQRRQRAAAAIAECEAWKQCQAEKEAQAEVEHNRRRIQLELAKLL